MAGVSTEQRTRDAVEATHAAAQVCERRSLALAATLNALFCARFRQFLSRDKTHALALKDSTGRMRTRVLALRWPSRHPSARLQHAFRGSDRNANTGNDVFCSKGQSLPEGPCFAIRT